MPSSGPSKSKVSPKAITRVLQSKPLPPGIDSEESAILESIRRYEAKIAPRLGDKRPKEPHAPIVAKAVAEIRDIVNRTIRENQKIRIRFSVRLPGPLIDRMREREATQIDLRPGPPGKLLLSLYKSDNAKRDRNVLIETISLKAVSRPREKPDERPDPVLPVLAHKREFSIALPRPNIPARLLSTADVHQGGTQKRIADLTRIALPLGGQLVVGKKGAPASVAKVTATKRRA